MNKVRKYKVISNKNIDKHLFVIRLERNGFEFIPGQCVTIGIPKIGINREYSVCSGINDKFLEFLIEKVPNGVVSPLMRKLKKGSQVSIDGAFGLFTIKDLTKKYIFVYSGAGQAPFQSMIKSYPKLNYKLVEILDKIDKEAEYFICGDSIMINKNYDILRKNNVNGSNIHLESFY